MLIKKTRKYFKINSIGGDEIGLPHQPIHLLYKVSYSLEKTLKQFNLPKHIV